MSDEFETRARAAACAIAVFRTGYVDERFVADATTIIAREIEAACAEATARADRLTDENARLRALAVVPRNQAIVDEAVRKAAEDEREACATKAANHYIGSTFPGDYRYCCDIEAEIRARAKGGA